jgi:hypothetical protein
VSRPGCIAAALLAFLWGTNAFAYDQHRPPESLDRDLRPIEYAPPCLLREVGRPPAAKRGPLEESEAFAAGHDPTMVAADGAAAGEADFAPAFSTLPPDAAAEPPARAFDARGPPPRA